MIEVHFQGIDSVPRIDQILSAAGEECLRHQKVSPEAELSILLSNDQILKELNDNYLELNHPTDVLSFPNADSNPESGNLYLGDIAISIDSAELQANKVGHSLEDELQLLVVHGILHLLGFDHTKKKLKDKMWSAQNDILQALDVNIDHEIVGNY